MGGTSLEAIVGAARRAILVIATARRITVTDAHPTTLHVDAERFLEFFDAVGDLAHLALRLADDGATLSVDIQPLESGEAVLAFGPLSLRIPVCDRPVGTTDFDARAQRPRQTG